MNAGEESKFDYDYVPECVRGRVKNWRNLTMQECMELTWELSVAAWARIGVIYDPASFISQ